MKPTETQCRLAVEIGAALVHQAGRSATDLIRAGQNGSPMLDRRVELVLSNSRNVPPHVAELVREFYAEQTDRAGESDDRTESLRIRLSTTEKSHLQRQAGEAGMSVSAYVRSACNL